jgi:hypothetical protein
MPCVASGEEPERPIAGQRAAGDEFAHQEGRGLDEGIEAPDAERVARQRSRPVRRRGQCGQFDTVTKRPVDESCEVLGMDHKISWFWLFSDGFRFKE